MSSRRPRTRSSTTCTASRALDSGLPTQSRLIHKASLADQERRHALLTAELAIGVLSSDTYFPNGPSSRNGRRWPSTWRQNAALFLGTTCKRERKSRHGRRAERRKSPVADPHQEAQRARGQAGRTAAADGGKAGRCCRLDR